MPDDLNRVTDIFSIGSLSNLARILASDCQRFGADKLIRVASVLDFKRTANPQVSGFSSNGVLGLSPPLHRISASVGGATDDHIMEEFRTHWEPLLLEMVQRWVQAHDDPLLIDPQVLSLEALTSGQWLLFTQLLTFMADRKPSFHPSLLTVISDEADKRPKSVKGYDRVKQLQLQGKLEGVYLIDNAGPLALTLHRQVLDRLVTTALASALRAQSFGLSARSFSEMSRTLGEYSPFAGMRFASQRLPVGREPKSWKVTRQAFGPFVKLQERGLPPPTQTLVTETLLATRRALAEPTASAIEADMDLDSPFFVIYTVPLSDWPSERYRWVEFNQEVNSHPTCLLKEQQNLSSDEI